MEHLQYPIGKFIAGLSHGEEDIKLFIHQLELLPKALKNLTENISNEDLKVYPY